MYEVKKINACMALRKEEKSLFWALQEKLENSENFPRNFHRITKGKILAKLYNFEKSVFPYYNSVHWKMTNFIYLTGPRQLI